MPRRKSAQSNHTREISLRGIRDQDGVWSILDEAFHPHLQSKTTMRFRIIVGKGLSSNRLLEDKNPVRYWAESYLNELGLSWFTPPEHEGGSGVMCIDI